MSWINMNYFPHAKRHYVHDSVVDIVRNDVERRHELLPDTEEVLEGSLRIDPGGMINMNSKPISKDFDGCEVSIKPEHILNAAIVWTTHRALDERTASGEEIVKVYYSQFAVAVMPRSMYDDIGCWIALSKAEGLVARAEIAEALNGHPNIYIAQSDAIDEV